MHLTLRDPTRIPHAIRAVLLAAAIMIGTCAAGAQLPLPRCAPGPLAPYADGSWPRGKWYLDQVIRTRDTTGCSDASGVIVRRLTDGFVNPFDQILRKMDTLGLDAAQSDSLASLNRTFSRARMELAMWVMPRVITLRAGYSIDSLWAAVLPKYESFVAHSGEWGSAAKAVLKPQQLTALQPVVAGHLEPTCIRERLFGVVEGKTEIERAAEIANRRRRTGCPW
jgi:hypothetical protein